MQLKECIWIVLLVVFHATSTMPSQLHTDNDYFYQDADMDDAISLNSDMQQRIKKFFGVPSSAMMADADAAADGTTTECEKPAGETTAAPGPADNSTTPATPEAGTGAGDSSSPAPPPAPGGPVSPTSSGNDVNTMPTSSGSSINSDQEAKTKELRTLVQHLYIAQARVQLEATEIKKSQAVANVAQQQLEEAASHVRAVTAALQNAQQEVAAAAIRAQTAQLQLAAHDQLLFAARQDVDALSSQMVGLQAAEGISQPKITFDVTGLLEKLKQPLAEDQKPTPVPTVVPIPTAPPPTGRGNTLQQRMANQDFYYE